MISRMLRTLLFSAACAVALHSHAQMTTATANELGRAADAAAFERIIALGDPALVRSFGYGLGQARIEVMPAAIEALVVKHYDDARVGEALRTLGPRYQTRALFDAHYARAKTAYRSDDAVFKEILRTDQPGVLDPLLAIAPRFASRPGEPNPVMEYAARRKHPAAVTPMIAAMEASYASGVRSNPLDMLLNYDEPEVWKRAGAEVERLKREGKISEKAYALAQTVMGPQVADPEGYVARRRSAETMAAYTERRKAVVPPPAPVELQASDPRRYVQEQARHLAQLEALGAEYRDEGVDYNVGGEYGRLGLFARYRVGDPAFALPYLEKAAKGRDLLGQVALADTYQLALRDKANALRAYQFALDTASETGKRITPYAGPDNPMNAFWKAWLTAEIAFLRSGQPFRGRVSEPAIAGFWQAQGVWPSVLGTYVPERPAKPSAVAPSRLALFQALGSISLMPDADSMLRELARHDPSGYWTTIVMGSVAFYSSPGRDAAAAEGLAGVLPGMASEARPGALATAARRHLQSRELRTVRATGN